MVPAQRMDGQPFTLSLTVDETEQVAAPSSLPLIMVANFRSMYNKIKHVKLNLRTLGLNFLIGSESWERPRFNINSLIDSPNFQAISYCRGRETPGIRPAGRQAGKPYPSKIGGGAVILYNKNRFELIDSQIGVSPGIEAVWGVFSARRMDHQLQRVKNVCIGPTLRSWLHETSALIMTLCPGLKKNYTSERSYNSIPGTTCMSGFLENCQKSIPKSWCSPNQGTISDFFFNYGTDWSPCFYTF